MEKPLDGKAVVVVGGTTGLGLSAAKALLAAGANVVVVGRDPNSVQAAQQTLDPLAPGHARAISGDAIQPDTAAHAIALCHETFGSFNGLYHVAGGSGRSFGDGPLHEITDEAVSKTLELNLQSLIYSNRAATQYCLKHNVGASILNMGSVLGYAPSPHFFSTHIYAAAKAAVIGFTQSVAAYYAKQNIRFNVIAPALVETPMAQRAATDDAILQFIKTKQPLDGGRIGRPEDLDALVVCLLSDQTRFVTGQVIAVDGGWSVSEGQIQ